MRRCKNSLWRGNRRRDRQNDAWSTDSSSTSSIGQTFQTRLQNKLSFEESGLVALWTFFNLFHIITFWLQDFGKNENSLFLEIFFWSKKWPRMFDWPRLFFAKKFVKKLKIFRYCWSKKSGLTSFHLEGLASTDENFFLFQKDKWFRLSRKWKRKRKRKERKKLKLYLRFRITNRETES